MLLGQDMVAAETYIAESAVDTCDWGYFLVAFETLVLFWLLLLELLEKGVVLLLLLGRDLGGGGWGFWLLFGLLVLRFGLWLFLFYLLLLLLFCFLLLYLFLFLRLLVLIPHKTLKRIPKLPSFSILELILKLLPYPPHQQLLILLLFFLF